MVAPEDMPSLMLGLARDDELAARALLSIRGVTDAIVGFHAQQAAEKSFKAVLAHHGIDFPYTHDLDGLAELCAHNGIEVPVKLDDVDELSPYGVQLRYGASRPSRLDRDQALRLATDAVGWAPSVIESGKTGWGSVAADSPEKME